MTPDDLLSKYLPILKELESDLASLKREEYTITVGPRDMQPEALTGAQNSLYGLRYALTYVKTTSDMADQALARGMVQGHEADR